jgi:hypothetical protein
MNCNECNRRNCKGEDNLQDAQACRFFRQPQYKERRIIDRISDSTILALYNFRKGLPK